MIIDFMPSGGFSPQAFKNGAISLRKRWLALLIETASRSPTEEVVWTEELDDLIEFGKWLVKSPVCPINIRVRIGNAEHLYGPDGNLYRCREYTRGPENIALSAYRESK